MHEAVKQALMRLLDDPQVQQKVSEILSRRIRQKPQLSPNASPADGSIFLITGAEDPPNRIAAATA